nr:hypothetical protein B0A51_10968 [Rachicladosporium sp. CCFEE 5018]
MSEGTLPSTADILASTAILSPPDSAHKVVRLGEHLVAKYGEQVTLTEGQTMQYIAEHSKIPVPRVHATFTDQASQQTFIVMDFVHGETLANLLPKLTQSEKDDIGLLVRDALDKLRELPEPGYFGSIARGACSHGMFWSPDGPDPLMSGPFDSEAAFNEGLLRKLATTPDMAPSYLSFLRTLFTQAFSGHRTTLCHGDLQPKNIMVQRTGSKEDGTGSFTISLIDWETSGWYPEYWEYCHSIIMGRFKPEWLEMVDKILPVYGYEYALMQMIFHILYY